MNENYDPSSQYDPAKRRTVLVDGVPLPEMLDEQTIHDVVHGFYDKIRADDLLGPIFNGVVEDWPDHLQKMCDFWSSGFLRTSRYAGQPLRPHLVLPDIGEEHFRRWLTLFRATVHAVCPEPVADLFMNRAIRIAHSFRLARAFHHGESTLDIRPILEGTLSEADEATCS
jgi:hemoglobin